MSPGTLVKNPEAWIEAKMTELSPKIKHNWMITMVNSRIDFERDFVGTPSLVELPKATYYRIRLREDRWQKATQFDWHPHAWTLRGGHGSTTVGAAGILTTRQIVPGDFVGVYAKLTYETGNEWLSQTMNSVAVANKNQSGILFEVKARVRYEPVKSGGTEAEDDIVRSGRATHYGKGKESLWQVPFDFLDMTALWIPCTGWCMDDMPSCWGDSTDDNF